MTVLIEYVRCETLVSNFDFHFYFSLSLVLEKEALSGLVNTNHFPAN